MSKCFQKGSALLTALFIITLVAIMATAVSARLRLDIYRTNLLETTDRLSLAAQGVTFWAMDRLTDPDQILTKQSDTKSVLDYPTQLKHSYPNVTISAQVFDLQALFNVNNLLSESYQPPFFSLLKTLDVCADSYACKKKMDAIINWISPPKTTVSHDEWFDRYAKQKPMYFPSHFAMQHISELRLVYGISAKNYQTLIPYVSALPETTPININTASKKLLQSIGDHVTDEDISRILNERAQKPYKDLSAGAATFIDKYHIKADMLTVESHYFLLITTASLADVTLKYFTILKRNKDKSGLWHASIIAESINTL